MHIMIALYFFFRVFMVNLLHYWVPGCSMYRLFTLIVWFFLSDKLTINYNKVYCKDVNFPYIFITCLKFWIIIWTYFYLPSFKLGRVQWTATCIVIILIKNYGWKLWVFEFFNTFTAFPFYIWIVSDFFFFICAILKHFICNYKFVHLL